MIDKEKGLAYTLATLVNTLFEGNRIRRVFFTSPNQFPNPVSRHIELSAVVTNS